MAKKSHVYSSQTSTHKPNANSNLTDEDEDRHRRLNGRSDDVNSQRDNNSLSREQDDHELNHNEETASEFEYSMMSEDYEEESNSNTPFSSCGDHDGSSMSGHHSEDIEIDEDDVKQENFDENEDNENDDALMMRVCTNDDDSNEFKERIRRATSQSDCESPTNGGKCQSQSGYQTGWSACSSHSSHSINILNTINITNSDSTSTTTSFHSPNSSTHPSIISLGSLHSSHNNSCSTSSNRIIPKLHLNSHRRKLGEGNQRAPRKAVRRMFTNSRERWRQQNVNGAFSDLRRLVPTYPPDKKLSKNEILRLAIKYIRLLSAVLDYQKQEEGSESKESVMTNGTSGKQHHGAKMTNGYETTTGTITSNNKHINRTQDEYRRRNANNVQNGFGKKCSSKVRNNTRRGNNNKKKDMSLDLQELSDSPIIISSPESSLSSMLLTDREEHGESD